MDIISSFAPYFERYITLEQIHPEKAYDYKARNMTGLPVVDITMHGHKMVGESYLYVAIPVDAKLEVLRSDEQLYVGSQTSVDRMFRGDNMDGKNFHHAQMRSGNGDDNLISYLGNGGKVAIHRLPASRIEKAVSEVPQLGKFKPLLKQTKKHTGYWFEQLFLFIYDKKWRWNTAGAEKSAQLVFNALR